MCNICHKYYHTRKVCKENKENKQKEVGASEKCIGQEGNKQTIKNVLNILEA